MAKPWGEFEFSLAGEYNVLNATAAAAMAANYGIPAETIAKALREFRSVKRRLEVKAEVHGITIIDDFAHHPDRHRRDPEGGAHTLSMAGGFGRFWSRARTRLGAKSSSMSWRRVCRLRMRLCWQMFSSQRPFLKTSDWTLRAVVADLNAAGKPARLLEMRTRSSRRSRPSLRAGDVVAILSNGGFGGIYEKLPARLKSLHEVATTA